VLPDVVGIKNAFTCRSRASEIAPRLIASGTLFSTTGPPLGTSFDPSQVQVFQAGNVHIIFNDANNGDLFYTVGSVTDHRPITRQLF